MPDIWKTLAAPIIASIIGGIIVGIILGRINAPEAPALNASVQWVDVRNPLYVLDRKSSVEIEKLAQSLWGGIQIGGLLEVARRQSTIRLLSIELRNTSNIRSQEIEVSSKQGMFFAPQLALPSQPLFQFKIPPLNPNERLLIVGVFDPWLYFQSAPILLLHGGKKLDLHERVLADETYGALRFPQEHPVIAVIVMIFLAGCAIFVIIGIPIAILNAFYPSVRAKLTTKEEMAKLLKFVRYVEEHHPEKLPAPDTNGAPSSR